MSVPAGDLAFDVGNGGPLCLENPDVQAIIEMVQEHSQTVGHVLPPHGDLYWWVERVDFDACQPTVMRVSVKVVRHGIRSPGASRRETLEIDLFRCGTEWLSPRLLFHTVELVMMPW